MSIPFLESASAWTGAAAIWLTAGAAVAGIFAWYFSSRLADARQSELDRFKRESQLAIKTADARAAEANQRAEEAAWHTAMLQRKLGDRYLTEEEMKVFVAASKNSPKPEFLNVIADEGMDNEARQFARNIRQMLEAAGYHCVRLPQGEWERSRLKGASAEKARAFAGVRLQTKSAASVFPWKTELVGNFDKIGIWVREWSAAGTEIAVTPDDSVAGIIVVGRKPEVELPPPWRIW